MPTGILEASASIICALMLLATEQLGHTMNTVIGLETTPSLNIQPKTGDIMPGSRRLKWTLS